MITDYDFAVKTRPSPKTWAPRRHATKPASNELFQTSVIKVYAAPKHVQMAKPPFQMAKKISPKFYYTIKKKQNESSREFQNSRRNKIKPKIMSAIFFCSFCTNQNQACHTRHTNEWLEGRRIAIDQAFRTWLRVMRLPFSKQMGRTSASLALITTAWL